MSAGIGGKAGAPPAPTSSPGGITVGPGPDPATATSTTTTSQDQYAPLLAAMGQLFQQAGQGLGQQLGAMNQQGQMGDQATLPNYLRAPYEAGGQYGSPIQQALSQYMGQG